MKRLRKTRRKYNKENRKLCKRYPFLTPWNRWTGKLITKTDPNYNWSYTELDMMPDGWRKAFGIQMCEELRGALVEDRMLHDWRIVQIKEKYGALCIYGSGVKKGSRVWHIIDKYSDLSMRTCIKCGEPATKMTLGWVSPYCDKCCPEENAMDINEYLNGDDDCG